MDDMIDAVAALLRQTARDHHQAYLATDGADPDWPWWYAEHLVDPLVDLGVSLTRSMIVFVLLSAQRDLPDAGNEWPQAYARRLVAEAG